MLKRKKFRAVRLWQFAPFIVFFAFVSLGMDAARELMAGFAYMGLYFSLLALSIRYGRVFALANYMWLGTFLTVIWLSVSNQFDPVGAIPSGIGLVISIVLLLSLIGIFLELV
ncbi:MAG: hypothetical protein AAFX00_02535, partial [Pseudomonadota bacterium]